MKIDQTPFEALLLKTKVKFRANMQGWRARAWKRAGREGSFRTFGGGCSARAVIWTNSFLGGYLAWSLHEFLPLRSDDRNTICVFFVRFCFSEVYGICLRCGIFLGGERDREGGRGESMCKFCALSNKGTKASLISFIKNFRWFFLK